ncbi:hypothetical protein [Nostoc sp. FACHB-888]|uniref:hypothetical protein n=1 Tax=Nostoc sp. FACHB-888 TaxID=2692842 RepID=UPI0019B1ABB2|nr:hypothetical protein [Nostoc sp. FACHB-888]MBD2247178.1 hypothetical protein [Nostoc sp. FACHB-888]
MLSEESINCFLIYFFCLRTQDPELSENSEQSEGLRLSLVSKEDKATVLEERLGSRPALRSEVR